jgi:hypothetical protein
MTDARLQAILADTLAGEGSVRTDRVIALPAAERPRALLPVARRRQAARILRAHYGDGGIRRRVMTSVLSALVACGIADRLRTWRVEPTQVPADRTFPSWAREARGSDHRVGLVLLGPPRANRKPVVLLVDDAGDLGAVAKIGWNDVTRPLVAYEASALAEIASALVGRVHVPTLIDARRIGDLELMMMAPLPPLQAGRTVSRAMLVETVRAVADVSSDRRVDLSSCLAHARMQPLEDAVAGITARTVDARVGSAHGDLHPGNLGVAADGRPVLWDWERWMHGVPVGFDLLHHDLQTWVGVERVDPGEAARRLIGTSAEILAPLGVSATEAPDVAKDYLVRLAARYVQDAQDEAGSRLGRVESWLFPAVLADSSDKGR